MGSTLRLPRTLRKPLGRAAFRFIGPDRENPLVPRLYRKGAPMIPRLLCAASLVLTLPGCVAALPLVTQLASGGGSPSQLCGAMLRMPGQTAALCDRIPGMLSGQTAQATPPAAAANAGTARTIASR